MQPSKPNHHTHPWGDHETPYLAMGGELGTRRLANEFYDVIEEESPRLREMLPRNTAKTREKFFMYLSGWLGGPPLYEQRWGHPRLRMRHMPFEIGEQEAGEWMRCMRQAMERAEIDEPLRSFLDERLEPLAQHMRNR